MRHASQRGSALIEVLVAAVIFVLVTLGLTSSTLNAKRSADGSRHAAEATTLAFDKLEQLRTLAPTDSALTAGTHTDALNPMTVTGGSGGIFTRTWTVTTLISVSPAITAGVMARIDMRVSWPTNGGAGSVTSVAYYKMT